MSENAVLYYTCNCALMCKGIFFICTYVFSTFWVQGICQTFRIIPIVITDWKHIIELHRDIYILNNAKKPKTKIFYLELLNISHLHYSKSGIFYALYVPVLYKIIMYIIIMIINPWKISGRPIIRQHLSRIKYNSNNPLPFFSSKFVWINKFYVLLSGKNTFSNNVKL